MTLPGYGIGALLVLLAYAVQSEIRFGRRARTMRAAPADRSSTVAVSIAAAIPVLGFVLAMKANTAGIGSLVPRWFLRPALPGMPIVAWAGVALGASGLALRLWAVFTLRERYTRTLLIQGEHAVERGGPYGWIRHPGYLGSLLCLNGIALASGSVPALIASLVATLTAYRYRIRVEDDMLVHAFGDSYAEYRRQVGALLPRRHS